MLFLDEAVKFRKSVRDFLSKEVKEEDIEAVLRAGTEAPSAKNRQPWSFVRLGKAETDKLASLMCDWADLQSDKSGSVRESARITKNAPVVIAVCSPVEKEWPQSDYISIGACLENMSLKAVDIGLGSLIVCDVWCVEKEARTVVGTTSEITALFLLGYHDDASVDRKRKDLADLVRGVELGKGHKTALDSLPEAAVGEEKFVFISYSHGDRDLVLSDIVELKRHGIALWYDKSIMYGKKWDEEALGVIARHNCVAMLLYVSKDSLSSDAVEKELLQAKKCKVPIFPIHIGGKPLQGYVGSSKGKNCSALLDDRCKFISRSAVPAVCDAIEEIAETGRKLGVVALSGIYDDFHYEIVNDGVKITFYNGTSETVTVPARISGKPVVEIGDNAICRNNSIKKIVLPFCVRRIGAGAFRENAALEEVVFPQTLDQAGAAVFRECTSIKSVGLPSGLKRIPEAFFRGCISLVEALIPYGIEELGEAVFNGCTSLERVFIPDSVKKMTEGGFFGCENLRELRIPEDIVGLEINSFASCPLLTVTAGGFRYVNGVGEHLKK